MNKDSRPSLLNFPFFSTHMKVVVMNRGLSADRVIAIRNGFLSRHREYPSWCIEVAAVVSICKGAGGWAYRRCIKGV